MFKLTHHGNASIGAFSIANDSIAFIASDATNKFYSNLKLHLKVEPVKLTIFNSEIIGIYASLNSSHIVLPSIVETRELDAVKQHVEPIIMKEKENAWGNLIAMNDRGIIASPYLKKSALDKLEDETGLEVHVMSVAGYKSVGAVIFATNKGALVSYNASEDEKETIREVLKVPVLSASVNLGSQFISLGLVANGKGYVVGELTTGVEIARIEEGLDLIR